MSMGEIEKGFYRQSILESTRQKLATTPTLCQILQRRCCIYRVPKLLRKGNEEVYTPVLVSIGPFHHKNERLRPMDAYKLIYLRSFIDNSRTNGHLEPYLEIIMNKESEIRECYEEPIDMSKGEFIERILIDSIFVIEVLRTRDIVKPFTLEEISHDLKLPENQLPFFILEDLYRAAFMSDTPTLSFTDLAWAFFENDRSRVEVTNEAASSCYHLLDLLRRYHLLPQQTNTNEEMHRHVDINESSLLCPTATRLYEAGVKFRVKDTPCSLLDIHFDKKKGILTIPKLEVTDFTENLFRNMIAFEQCHYPPHTQYISSYQYFMDCLINTREDVELLSKARIIHSSLGSDEEVANLLNSLGTHVSLFPIYYPYAGTVYKVNKHCKKKWNGYKATLKHKYFTHPWAVLSVIYAVILLLLTIAQLVIGILSVPGVKK